MICLEHRRRAYVVTRTVELARSGVFRSWREIGERLTHDGFPEAEAVLESPVRRAMLDRLCEAYRRNPSTAPAHAMSAAAFTRD